MRKPAQRDLPLASHLALYQFASCQSREKNVTIVVKYHKLGIIANVEGSVIDCLHKRQSL